MHRQETIQNTLLGDLRVSRGGVPEHHEVIVKHDESMVDVSRKIILDC
jgi:hypothetical protein